MLKLAGKRDDQEKLKLLGTIKDNMKPGAPFVLVSAYRDVNAEIQDRLNVLKSLKVKSNDYWQNPAL
ncbi:MAG: hypothetical protein ACQEXQ_22695 [Bacillota bacterium]